MLGLAGLSLALGLAISLLRASSAASAGAGPALGGVFAETFSLIVVVMGAAALTLRSAISEPLARLIAAFEAQAPVASTGLDEAARLAAAALRLSESERAEARRFRAGAEDLQRRLIAAEARGEARTPLAILEGLGAAARGDLTLRLSEGENTLAAGRYDQAVALVSGTIAAFATSLQAFRDGGESAERTFLDYAEGVGARAEEIGSAVRALAAAAARDEFATPVAAAAGALAEAGGAARAHAAVAERAATLFDEIAATAEQISSAAALSDELAFQTSLLALNAGVEAARCGESGRGIAVVAQELRALSQRATQAAKSSGALVAKLVAEATRGANSLEGAEGEWKRFSERAAELELSLKEIAHSLANRKPIEERAAEALDALERQRALGAGASEQISQTRVRQAALVQSLSQLIERFRLRVPARSGQALLGRQRAKT